MVSLATVLPAPNLDPIKPSSNASIDATYPLFKKFKKKTFTYIDIIEDYKSNKIKI